MSDELQSLCEAGQSALMRTDYLEADHLLTRAEKLAWGDGDWDTLSRLYMPLQEARRQRRQRCGEGIVCLDLIAQGAADRMDGRHVVENFPFGQLLVAGWGSIEPALEVRRLARQFDLFVETFLGAVYPVPDGRIVAIIPIADIPLPPPDPTSIEELRDSLPFGSIVIPEHELPKGSVKGSAQTYAHVMDLWERLHTPFLARARACENPIDRMKAYRRTLEVDSACEFAHQELSQTARELARSVQPVR